MAAPLLYRGHNYIRTIGSVLKSQILLLSAFVVAGRCIFYVDQVRNCRPEKSESSDWPRKLRLVWSDSLWLVSSDSRYESSLCLTRDCCVRRIGISSVNQGNIACRNIRPIEPHRRLMSPSWFCSTDKCIALRSARLLQFAVKKL